MENASKALLIGASILFAVMIMSLLLIAYNQISAYYSAKYGATMIEQNTEFNNKFENYNQKKIRGNDMISFMNQVIDYNERQSYQVGTNYKRLEVTITLGNSTIINKFKYNTSDVSIFSSETLSTGKITNSGSGTDPKELDKNLKLVTSVLTELTNVSTNGGIPNVTEGKLQKLTSNISNICLDTHDESDENDMTIEGGSAIEKRKKRAELIKNILGVNISIDENTGKTTDGRLDSIKKMTSKYYQYTQFKRAYFECTGTTYDEETGRILTMQFKLKTNGNNIVFN